MKKELWILALVGFMMLELYFNGLTPWILIGFIGNFVLCLRQLQNIKAWVLLFLFMGIFGLRLIGSQQSTIFPENLPMQGTVIIDSNQVKINGDSLTGIAEFRGKVDHSQEKQDKVFFSYHLTSQEEQLYWQQNTQRMELSVQGTFTSIESARNKGTFDARQYYRSKGIQQRFKIEHYTVQRIDTSLAAQWSHWRKLLLNQLLQQPDTAIRSYALLLIFGERKEIETSIIDHYQQLSILHLLAISGLHITLLIQILQSLLWRRGLTREKAVWVIITFLFVFAWLMNWNVSGMRAIGMYVVQQIAKKFGKYISQMDSLAIVWLGAIIYQPTLSLGIAFQLSYGLTFIVLLVNRFVKNQWTVEWKRQLLTPIVVVWVALPLICQYFYTWNAWSILLTALIVGVFERFLLPALLLYVSCVWLQLSAGIQWLTFLVNTVLGALHQLLAFCEQFPGMKLTFGRWQLYEWLIYWGILCFLAITIEQKWGTRKIRGSLWLLSLLLLLFVPYHWGYELVMLDIGQGDAILLLCPGWNQATLIDTGGIVQFPGRESWRQRQFSSQAKQTLIPALQAEGISQLSQVMLSHADFDHIGNLPELLWEIPTREIVVAQGMEQLPKMQQIKQEQPATQWHLVTAGSHWQYQATDWQVLSPTHPSTGENQDSLIVLVQVAGQRILLTGDAPGSAEEAVLANYPTLAIDILKVGHHGSRTSTTNALLAGTHPKYALISAGVGNQYHHPNEDTLQRLVQYQVETYVTKTQGAIRVQLSPSAVTITTALSQ